MSATLHFLTGGTTRTARLVSYSEARWRRSVQVKAKVLSSHGVQTGAVVGVCHPFSPWSVGQIHAEGALLCGAEVYPFGLNALSPEVARLLLAAGPTHLCGGARLLLQLAGIATTMGLPPRDVGVRKLLVAGEMLTDHIRETCEETWGAEVVDVYGMAEFDALGCELPGQAGISLVNDFRFAIRSPTGEIAAPAVGACGELHLRAEDSEDWVATGDVVECLQADSPGPGFSHRVRMRGREDFVVNFADGTAISEPQVMQVISEFPDLKALQIQVCDVGRGELIRALCVPHESVNRFDFRPLRERLVNVNVDVADSFLRGVIVDCMIDVYPTDLAFFQTPRGKRPLLVRMN